MITDAIWRDDLPIRVFTLDTGRLFEETYALIDATREKYGKAIEVFFPDTAEVEALVSMQGPSQLPRVGRGPEGLLPPPQGASARSARCRASTSGSPVCGASSRTNRQTMRIIEWDEGYGLLKCNPLIDWDADTSAGVLEATDVPDNPLHRAGLREHRLRALHARHRARGGPARGPLVVGDLEEGMRAAPMTAGRRRHA